MDGDGYFWFVGRADDVIISSGFVPWPLTGSDDLVGRAICLESAVTTASSPRQVPHWALRSGERAHRAPCGGRVSRGQQSGSSPGRGRVNAMHCCGNFTFQLLCIWPQWRLNQEWSLTGHTCGQMSCVSQRGLGLSRWQGAEIQLKLTSVMNSNNNHKFGGAHINKHSVKSAGQSLSTSGSVLFMLAIWTSSSYLITTSARLTWLNNPPHPSRKGESSFQLFQVTSTISFAHLRSHLYPMWSREWPGLGHVPVIWCEGWYQSHQGEARAMP